MKKLISIIGILGVIAILIVEEIIERALYFNHPFILISLKYGIPVLIVIITVIVLLVKDRR